MGRIEDRIILPALLLSLITVFIDCSSKNNPKGTFGIEQFQNEMKAKNYNFQMQDVEEDFLPAIYAESKN